MAYRQPAFMVTNKLTQIPLAQITASNFGNVAALVDGRFDPTSAVSLSIAGQRVICDFVTSTSVTSCWIPAGHNISGTVRLRSLFPSQTLGTTTAQVGSPISIFAASASPATQWLVEFDQAGAWSFGELWFGDRLQLSSAVAPAFSSGFEQRVETLEFPSRTEFLEISPPRKTFRLTVRNIITGSSDFLIMLAIARNGFSRPFIYWPPDDTDAGPFAVTLARPAQLVQDFAVPTKSVRYRIDLEMVEVLS